MLKSDVSAGEPCQHVAQIWDCSEVENDTEGRDATGWLMDDEMMSSWEEVSQDEEEIEETRGQEM